MTEVRLEGLRKTYPGGVEAVAGLDLAVRSGEFAVLVGPSGCGKSTTLRLIAGLEHQDEGRVLFDGTDVSAWEPKRRDVAMVFQNYALYPHMDVRRNLAFPLRMRGVRKREAFAEAERTAALLGLENLLDRRPRQLSGGQQQRVALGRALIRRPRVFLLDEPLSNLDAKTRVELRAELRDLHRRLSITTIYVTHDQAEAMALGERIAVLDEGRLRQFAPPLELYRRPADRFVGAFIGSPPMEFHDVEPLAEGIRLADQTVRGVHPPPEPAVLGLRPHELRVVPASDTPARSLAARVLDLEVQGHEAFVRCRAGRAVFTGIVPGGATPPPGAPVGLVLPERPHYFSRADGRALPD